MLIYSERQVKYPVGLNLRGQLRHFLDFELGFLVFFSSSLISFASPTGSLAVSVNTSTLCCLFNCINLLTVHLTVEIELKHYLSFIRVQ